MPVVAAGLFGIAGCTESPTVVEFQVIEDTEFAASLGIDLGTMDRLDSGVYVKDIVVGTGVPAIFGTWTTVTFTGWLSDGTVFDDTTDRFFMGNSQVVPGFEDGLLNLRVGGTRLVIIPPNRGFGGIEQVDQFGNVTIPGGSILVFEITLDAVEE